MDFRGQPVVVKYCGRKGLKEQKHKEGDPDIYGLLDNFALI